MISLAVFGVFAIEGDKVSKSKVIELQGERVKLASFEVAAILHRVLEPRT
jgi:hypothetical protein